MIKFFIFPLTYLRRFRIIHLWLEILLSQKGQEMTPEEKNENSDDYTLDPETKLPKLTERNLNTMIDQQEGCPSR